MKNVGKTILFGVYAGLAIGFGGLLFVVSKTLLIKQEIWANILGSCLFPVGLTLVCFLGLNLFTGKIGYLLDNKRSYWVYLGLVYLGNLIGAILLGLLCLLIFSGSEIQGTAWDIGYNKLKLLTDFQFLPIMKLFAGSVLCGFCVYVAVFCYKVFKQWWVKVIGIFIPIFIFVFFGFNHCVANMFYFAFGWNYGNPLSYLNLLIVTLGNSIGAIALNELIKAFKKLFLKNDKKSA